MTEDETAQMHMQIYHKSPRLRSPESGHTSVGGRGAGRGSRSAAADGRTRERGDATRARRSVSLTLLRCALFFRATCGLLGLGSADGSRALSLLISARASAAARATAVVGDKRCPPLATSFFFP